MCFITNLSSDFSIVQPKTTPPFDKTDFASSANIPPDEDFWLRSVFLEETAKDFSE